jgi:hypothetical protein
MKKIIILIFILSPILNFAQKNDSLKMKSLSIGVTYSTDYCYRIISAKESMEWLKNQMDTLEIAKIGFTTGINFDYRLSKRLSISSGILYSDKGEKLKEKVVPTIEKSINHINYIDIPFKVNYNISTNKTKLYISAGISTNVFLSNKILIQKENSSSRDLIIGNSDFSKINLASILNIGINQDISENWYFKTELLYRQSINSLIKSDLNRYLYSVGLNLGFYYRLK